MRELRLIEGYIRVSTDEQAREGISPEAQRARIVAHAEAHGLPLGEIHDDSGRSARSLDRPKIRLMLGRLSAGEVDGILVAKLDRLTRSLRDWSALVEDHFLAPDGPRLISASEAIETRTAGGRFVLNIIVAASQWELETGAERTEAVMSHKRSKGERLGNLPYGRALGEDGRTLVPCPPEVEALAVMRDLRRASWTTRAIAGQMNRLGIATRSGRPWAHSTVAKLLRGDN